MTKRETPDINNVIAFAGSAALKATTTQAGTAPRATLVCLSDVRAERVDWLWPSYVPRGTITILEGDPEAGKTTLLLDLAARITTGDPMPFQHARTEPGSVLLMTAEDSLSHTIVPRLEAAGADRSRIWALTEVNGELPMFPEHNGDLEEAIRRCNAKLVLIDPLFGFLSDKIKVTSDHEVRRAMTPLAKIAERTATTFMPLRHETKGSVGQKAMYRGGGGMGIVAAARAAFVVGEDPDQPDVYRIMAPIKSNLGRRPPSLKFQLVETPTSVGNLARVEWVGESRYSADDLARHAATKCSPPGKRDTAEEFLDSVLRNGPVDATEVEERARTAGISEATLKRAKAALGVRSIKMGMRGRFVWSLPGDLIIEAQPTDQ